MRAILLALFALISRTYLRTNAGGDWQSRVLGDTASTGTGLYASATYVALTESATAPAPGDTVLVGELVAEGLARAQGAYAHTVGASSYTISKTFTKTEGVVRTVAKAALLNAIAAGTMAFENLVTPVAVMDVSDQLALTWTVSI